MVKDTGADIKRNNKQRRWAGLSSAFITLIAEGGINFFRYLKSLGISQGSNLILLSSKHEYYYDGNNLKDAGILVNLRKLNLIRHLDMFLNALVHILPPDTSFIGYFSDNSRVPENDSRIKLLAPFTGKINKFSGERDRHSMDESEVTELLERNGFKVVDMRRMKGLTYFSSQYIRRPVTGGTI